MTSIEILPLIALVAMFVIATFFPINIGILGSSAHSSWAPSSSATTTRKSSPSSPVRSC